MTQPMATPMKTAKSNREVLTPKTTKAAKPVPACATSRRGNANAAMKDHAAFDLYATFNALLRRLAGQVAGKPVEWCVSACWLSAVQDRYALSLGSCVLNLEVGLSKYRPVGAVSVLVSLQTSLRLQTSDLRLQTSDLEFDFKDFCILGPTLSWPLAIF